MATRVDLPPLPQFDSLSDRSSLSQRWKAWTRRFETYLVATNITDDEQKRAMLLYQAGSETQDIFDTLTETGTDYATAKKKLDDYFSPKKNVNYEVFRFRQATQQPTESVEQFATRLRKLSLNCEFHDVDSEIKAAIIQSCTSKSLRRFALREAELTLDALLSKARSLEMSETQAASIEEKLQVDYKQSAGDINFMKGRSEKQARQSPSSPKQSRRHNVSHRTAPACSTASNSMPQMRTNALGIAMPVPASGMPPLRKTRTHSSLLQSTFHYRSSQTARRPAALTTAVIKGTISAC